MSLGFSACRRRVSRRIRFRTRRSSGSRSPKYEMSAVSPSARPPRSRWCAKAENRSSSTSACDDPTRNVRRLLERGVLRRRQVRHLDLARHAHQRHAHRVRALLRRLDGLLVVDGLAERAPHQRRDEAQDGQRQHHLDQREAAPLERPKRRGSSDDPLQARAGRRSAGCAPVCRPCRWRPSRRRCRWRRRAEVVDVDLGRDPSGTAPPRSSGCGGRARPRSPAPSPCGPTLAGRCAPAR